MRTLALDPTTNDLALDASGRTRLTDAGAESVRQRLWFRLSLWSREYALDTRVGIPYASYLGQKGVEAQFERVLRRAAATCPGVAALTAFAMAVDPATRRATITLEAQTAQGEPVTLDAFDAGALS